MFPGEDASATRSTFDVSAYLCCDAMGEPSTLLEYNLASDLQRQRASGWSEGCGVIAENA